jgi:hypothetical protein
VIGPDDLDAMRPECPMPPAPDLPRLLEAAALKRRQALASLKVWVVTHGFDATEGRGYFAETLVVTDAEQPALIQWCLDTFGPPLAGWYGNGFYEEWHLRPTPGDAAAAMAAAGTRKYGNSSLTKLAVVSQADWTWAGLPQSEFPWPRVKRPPGTNKG